MKREIIFLLFKFTSLILTISVLSGRACPAVASTTIIVESLPFAKKLSESVVSTLYVDRSDLLWAGTQHGLYLYDGTAVKEYGANTEPNTRLPSTDITELSEDAFGRTVFLSREGQIYYSTPKKVDFESLTVSLGQKQPNVNVLFKSTRDYFFLVTDDHLIVHDRYLTQISMHEMDIISKSFGKISRISETPSGVFYLLAARGIVLVKYDYYSRELTILETIGLTASSLAVGPKNSIFFSDHEGQIHRFDLTSKTYLASEKILPDGATVQELLWHEGRLWIASSSGLLLANQDLELIASADQVNSALPHDYVICLVAFQEHVLVGTFQGIGLASTSDIQTFSQKNSIIHDEVLALEVDKRGTTWVGTYDGLFYKEVDSAHTAWRGIDSALIFDQRIMTLEAAGDELWVGSRKGGISIISTTEKRIITPKSLQSEGLEVTKILQLDGDRVLVATYNQGLHLVSGSTISSVESIPEESVTVLLKTNTGNVYAGSEYRVYMSHIGSAFYRQMNLRFPEGIYDPLLLSLSVSSDGHIYVGTKDHGLFKFLESADIAGDVSLTRASSNKLLAVSSVYSLEIDKQLRIWAATNNGLFVISSNGELLERLQTKDGVQSNNFNFGASTKSLNGDLLFGGMKGYSKLAPSKIVGTISPTHTRITSIETPSESRWVGYLATLDLLEIDHTEHFLTINYASKSLSPYDDHQYRHKLQNFDPDWIEDAGRKSATYTNLPPGDYVFEVQAADATAVWGEEGVRLNVRVLPPPWETWWAYTLYAIIASLILYYGKTRYDKRLLNERALDYAEEVQANSLRIEDELQESHEYYDEQLRRVNGYHRDTLGLIRESVLSPIEDEHLRENLEVLSLLDDCASQSGDPLAVDLKQVVDELIVRKLPRATVPAEKITIINNVPDRPIHGRLAGPLALASAELLENALVHAFEPSSRANFIEIDLSTTGELDTPAYQLQVRDDGTGIPDEVVTSDTSPGLALLHRLAVAFGGALEFRVDTGTTAIFRLPSE